MTGANADLDTPVALQLRAAGLHDEGALEALIAVSARALQSGDYSAEQIEGALGRVFGVDRQLIADGTYFVVETAGEEQDRRIVGCGGWSRRRTLFGADAVQDRDDSELAPGVDAAKIRAFFVDPGWARRGVATRLLQACEAAARAAGFTAFELGATLTGEPFYARFGYQAVARLEAPLSSGLSLPIVRMRKTAA